RWRATARAATSARWPATSPTESYPQFLKDGYITENQYKIDVVKYDLFIDINIPGKMVNAEIEITGIITDQTLTSLDFNFYDNFNITDLILNGLKGKYNHSKTTLSILMDEIPLDTFNLKIKYEGMPKALGPVGFVFGEVNKHSLVYTLNQPEFASTWFPWNL
ncbi:MAG: hypothetical protein R6V77_02515, partial [Candidatus Cloacimonadaceae bacterium]